MKGTGRASVEGWLVRWHFMRHVLRRLVPGLSLGLAVVGVLGLRPATSTAWAGDLELRFEPDAPSLPLRYELVPDRQADPGSPSILEQRLAALAAAKERAVAAAPAPAGPGGLLHFDVEGLAERIEGVLAEVREQAQVSVHIRDLQTQHVLFDYFGDTPLIPASNQKLLTTSAALDLLGPDYTFVTEVALAGQDLYLVGTGDPAFDDDALAGLAERVADGIDLASVERLVVDDSAFSSRHFGPGYSADGDGVAYEAPSGALSLDFNTVEVRVRGARRGRPAIVTVEPPSSAVVVLNEARAGRRTRLSVRSLAREHETVVEVRGTVAAGRTYVTRRRTGDPGMFTAGAFAARLAELTASEPLPLARGVVPPQAETLALHESVPLLEILDRGMAYSNNFIAEQVLRTVAYELTGNPGDWETGQEVLYGYWSALGGRPGDLVIENGSGLSRRGRLTTSGLVDLISSAHRSAGRGPSLIDTLPAAGEPGTLRSRLRRSGDRVRAKTGTLDGVSGLSGVITSEDGTPRLAFSILTNVEEVGALYAQARRRIEDDIVTTVLAALDDYEAERTMLAQAG